MSAPATTAASGVPAVRFCNVAIPHARLGELTYEFDPRLFPGLGPGDCVSVPLRGRHVAAVVVSLVARSPVRVTKRVESLVASRLLGTTLLGLSVWAGRYYFGRQGEMLGRVLPRGICSRRARSPAEPPDKDDVGVEVRDAGVSVASSDDVDIAGFVLEALGRGSVILLAPEPRLAEWRASFGSRAIEYRASLGPAELRRVWRRLRSGCRQLVLGVRSAVFAPVADLAAMVVVDEQDKSFKEERHPRFNARDVAVVRCRMAGCQLLMVTRQPSVETWHNLRNGTYRRRGSARFGYERPDGRVVDMRRHRDCVISPALGLGLCNAVAQGRSVVLYMNRRGLSRHVVCRDCGAPLSCDACAVSLTLTTRGETLCRYCGRRESAPEVCPACNGRDFQLRSPGVEMVVREVKRLLPGVEPVIVDAEAVPPESVAPAVLVGTRTLLGLGWPSPLGVVAALSVDDDLCRPDFRAREQAFSVLSALARRAVDARARLYVQSWRTEDPAIVAALAGNVEGFLDAELSARQECGFPPHRRLALVDFVGHGQDTLAHAERIARRLARHRGVEVLGPVPIPGRGAPQRLMVKVTRQARLDRLVQPAEFEASGIRARVDIDPLDVA